MKAKKKSKQPKRIVGTLGDGYQYWALSTDQIETVLNNQYILNEKLDAIIKALDRKEKSDEIYRERQSEIYKEAYKQVERSVR